MEGLRGQAFEFRLEALGNEEPLYVWGTCDKGFIEGEAGNVCWLV